RKLSAGARKLFLRCCAPGFGGLARRTTWSRLRWCGTRRGLCSLHAFLTRSRVLAGHGLLYTFSNCLSPFLGSLCCPFNTFLNTFCSLLDDASRRLGGNRQRCENENEAAGKGE